MIFFTQQPGDSIRAAEHFKGIEAKAPGFIFNEDFLYPKQRGKFVQRHQRCRLIAGDFLMKAASLLRLLA